jgi:hypothetical protein
MRTEPRNYESDGLQMVSHIHYDEHSDGRRPGVLVFPAFGLGDHTKARVECPEVLGYVEAGAVHAEPH